MTKRVFLVFAGLLLLARPAMAQPKTVTGKVTNEQGAGVPGVQILVKGTTQGALGSAEGNYSIRVEVGQVLVFRALGHAPVERTVGADNTINVQLTAVATSLDAVVVSALGQTTNKRSLGTSQQSLAGPEIAGTQRENFINSIQGRVAGVEVTSTSGIPGASTSITIRGVSSISSSNSPLMIVDGLPLDNKTLNTGVLTSDGAVATALSNRNVDFTNRAADINPEDIESLVVLKGPEAAALYGIDAANGAIVITTKRGRYGASSLQFGSTFRIENTRKPPEVQNVFGPTTVTGSTIGSFQYFGQPYGPDTKFYDNVSGFFQTGMTQKSTMSFNGAASDNRLNYRLSVVGDRQEGVVPNSEFRRLNLTGSSQAQVNRWLSADLTMAYMSSDNTQPYKGENGPLIGLLLWPQTDNAKDWQTPAGNRRRITNAAAGSGEVDNPYFNVNKNKKDQEVSRLMSNLGLTVTPFSWGSLKSNIGVDAYSTQDLILRHPQSFIGFAFNGLLDQANDITRNINSQTLLNLNSRYLTKDLSISATLGNAISDATSTTAAIGGRDFLEPDFVSINNTNTTSRQNKTTKSQRRLVSLFGQAVMNYKDYLYVTGTLRNDWTSTIPQERNSFAYPGVTGSFIFSDAFPSVKRLMTGKLRAAFAEVGRDARPYAYRPALETKLTTGGGFGYGFWGPNLRLSPEFARSYEVGTELGFFEDRLGLDVTWYRKKTTDQIVNDIRGSYGTGFILFNLNGASTRSNGLEVTLRGTPFSRRQFTWDVIANFDRSRSKVLELPNALPESYVSDTWLVGNIRNGTAKGLSTRSLSGQFYLRNKAGDILIDPSTGLPIRSTNFIYGGYDRQPDFTMGVTNTLTYKRVSLSFLFDIRRGGDVFNATEHYLTTRGLSKRTLDRDVPRVIPGVLRDGREESTNPTRNTIVVIPAVQNNYYVNMSEELFIEKDINWLRLRDLTLRYSFPARILRARDASVFLTGTDLLLFTNYSGLDPIVNGNTAAVGGSGAAGVDFGNFPMPRGINFGFRLGY